MRLVDGSGKGCQFAVEVEVDEILVAMELGSVVAADALVVIRRGVARFVERIACAEVCHAVVSLVFQDFLVGGCFGVAVKLLHGVGETLLVEVFLVLRPEVGEAEHHQYAHSRPAFKYFSGEKPQRNDGSNDKQGGAQCRSGEQRVVQARHGI